MDDRAEKVKKEAEAQALSARWAIFWFFVLGALCLGMYFGLFIGFNWFGG